MIPLFKPFTDSRTEEIQKILNSSQLSYGKWGVSFEGEIKKFLDNEYILTTNSFGNSLIIGLLSLGLEKEDEILMSPVSCLASVSPIALYGFRIHWADIDPETGTLCPESTLKALKTNKNIKAIIHNNHCGYVGHLLEIKQLAESFGKKFIIDGIESFGTTINNYYIGSSMLADLTLFSFDSVRLLNSIEGGGMCFKYSKHYSKAKLLRDYGIDRTLFRKKNGELSKSYSPKFYGLGGKLSELHSYAGTVNISNITKLLKLQRKNAKFWNSNLKRIFSEFDITDLKISEKENPNYWVYGTLVGKKTEFIEHIKSLKLTGSGVHIPVNNYALYRQNSDTPGAIKFDEKFVAIPSGWWYNTENFFNGK